MLLSTWRIICLKHCKIKQSRECQSVHHRERHSRIWVRQSGWFGCDANQPSSRPCHLGVYVCKGDCVCARIISSMLLLGYGTPSNHVARVEKRNKNCISLHWLERASAERKAICGHPHHILSIHSRYYVCALAYIYLNGTWSSRCSCPQTIINVYTGFSSLLFFLSWTVVVAMVGPLPATTKICRINFFFVSCTKMAACLYFEGFVQFN